MREIRALAAAGHGIHFTTHDPNHARRCLPLRAGERIAGGAVGAVLTRDRLEDLYRTPVEEFTDTTTDHAAFLPG